ncbi:hypothetical protein [Mastigocoleus testarum]|uniref:Uncharacterized protein n=1 Tax=Mastigocoleus testarum BC008 TaxID=371196 RepID=A0A0V7ZXV4_9CYAN|nr:hypothetical protein [Mastigocoleus testarum]KST62499.1 hypothetical protein BC008_10030 [Mastigocoleus testarum BC008]KST69119.1 hypothetical protein BC008_34985 [Mastigocoleus testarum BC008]
MSHSNDLVEKEEISSLGASLQEIEPGILKKGYKKGATRVWYQGEEPYFDVFCELINDEIVWFQFTLRGKSVSWDKDRSGWQTGNTDELKINDVSFYAASKTIDNDSAIDWEFINLVKLILTTRTDQAVFIKVLALFNS